LLGRCSTAWATSLALFCSSSLCFSLNVNCIFSCHRNSPFRSWERKPCTGTPFQEEEGGLAIQSSISPPVYWFFLLYLGVLHVPTHQAQDRGHRYTWCVISQARSSLLHHRVGSTKIPCCGGEGVTPQ
jgi:hypothetical protein